MQSQKVKILLALITLLMLIMLQACEGNNNLSSYGNEFYLAFPRNYNGADNLTFTIHTLKTTSVQFSISSINNGFTYTGTTTAGTPSVVSIPLGYEVLGFIHRYRNLGFRITSLETEPISVVGWSEYNRNGRTFYSYLGLPCHTQPTNEYIYYGVSTYGFSSFNGYILLVGCRNNTNITIYPTQHANITMPINPQVSVSAHRTYVYGKPNTFVLHAGQTVTLEQDFVDISGTKIVSDAPLTVITGHTLSRVPAMVSNAEPIATQVPPTVTWGREFLLSPHHNRDNGQFYKIIAHRNNTVIQRKCGSLSAPINATLSSGQVYQFNTSHTTYCSLLSSKPIYIAQVGVSTFFDGGSYGDPTLNTVPPINQYLHSIEITLYFATLIRGLNILIPNDAYFDNHFIYNGIRQNLTGDWDATIYYPNGSIAGYGFSTTPGGTDIITHSNPLGKLFVSVYGWSTYHGYCYSGGMGLNPINPTLPFPEVSFVSELFSTTEGDSAVITLSRSVNTEDVVSVRVSVAALQVDTAKVGEDYYSKSVVITFELEEVMKTVTVQTINDASVEPTEYFTVRVYPIGQKVVVFPITECVVQILDNDYMEIGFTNTSMTLQNTTQASFELTTHNGDLQIGETVQLLLQIESLTGSQTVNSSHFDFQYYSGSYIASLNLDHLPFSLIYTDNSPVVKGRLSLVSSRVNTSINPSIITVTYTQEMPTQQQFVEPSTQEIISTVYLSPSPMIIVSTIYKATSILISQTCTNTVPLVTPIIKTVYVTPSVVSSNCGTQTESVSSSIIVGGVMSYIILIILCGIGAVGGFLCGRTFGSSKKNTHNEQFMAYSLAGVSHYPLNETDLNKNPSSVKAANNLLYDDVVDLSQSAKQFPLPAPPSKKEEIYDLRLSAKQFPMPAPLSKEEKIYDKLYTDMSPELYMDMSPASSSQPPDNKEKFKEEDAFLSILKESILSNTD